MIGGVAIEKSHARADTERNGRRVHHSAFAHRHGAVTAAAREGDTPRRIRCDRVMILRPRFGHRGLGEMAVAIGLVDAPRFPDIADLEAAEDVGLQWEMTILRMAEDQMGDASKTGKKD